MNGFIHSPIILPKVERISENGKRLYLTPSGEKYPSVTSVTSLGSEDSIQEWKDRVGEEEATRVSNRASSRGTQIHTFCEDWLNNKPVVPDMFDRDMWNKLKPTLNDISNIRGLETMLYSHKLELAGTADCIADYKGELSLIDFKTSGKLKQKEWISSYFIQTACYSAMIAEMTGILPMKLVILIAVDDHVPQIFVENTMDWLPKAIQIREEFRKIKGY